MPTYMNKQKLYPVKKKYKIHGVIYIGHATTSISLLKNFLLPKLCRPLQIWQVPIRGWCDHHLQKPTCEDFEGSSLHCLQSLNAQIKLRLVQISGVSICRPVNHKYTFSLILLFDSSVFTENIIWTQIALNLTAKQTMNSVESTDLEKIGETGEV